jgi:tetratricopeptide (TPR) repeat protein
MIVMAQLPAVSHAQSPPVSAPPPASAQAQAKAYVDKGIAAQNDGQYDVAITYYWQAHKLVPHPLLIFNIAQAHRLAGRIDQAIAMYERYLQVDPNGPQASTAQTLLAGLKARKTQGASRSANAGNASDARKPADAGASKDATAPGTAKLEATAPGAAQPEAARKEAAHLDDTGAARSMPATTGVPVNESPPTPGAELRLAGLITGAVGVVACGVAIRYGLRASSLSNELSGPNAVYSPTKVAEGHRADNIAIAAWITGGVLVGTGSVLYYLGYQQGRHAHSLTLAPVVSDKLTGLVVSGTLP